MAATGVGEALEPPNQQPSVTILGLRDVSLSPGDPIILEAAAEDADGIIKRVDFFRITFGVGGTSTNLVASVTESPFKLTLTNPPRGFYRFLAAAVDDKGASAKSRIVNRYVVYPGPKRANEIELPHDGPINSVALDHEGNVIVTSFAGKAVFSLSETFQTNWVADIKALTGFSFSQVSPPAIAPSGVIYVCLGRCCPGALLCLDKNGQKNWLAEPPIRAPSAPALGRDGSVYVQGDDTSLFRVLSNGMISWKNSIGSESLSAPCFRWPSPAIGPDGTIYVTSIGGLRAVRADGTTKWFMELGPIYASPVVGEFGEVYIATMQGFAYRISANGSIEWKTALVPIAAVGNVPRPVDLPSCIGPMNEMLFLNIDGLPFSLDGTSGVVQWPYEGGGLGTAFAAPAVDSDGLVYFPAASYFFMKDGPSGGWASAAFTTAPVYSAPTISESGFAYFGTAFGFLRQLAGANRLAPSAWPMFGHDAAHTGRVPEFKVALEKLSSGAIEITSASETGASHTIEVSNDFVVWQTLAEFTSTNRGAVLLESTVGRTRYFRLKRDR